MRCIYRSEGCSFRQQFHEYSRKVRGGVAVCFLLVLSIVTIATEGNASIGYFRLYLPLPDKRRCIASEHLSSKVRTSDQTFLGVVILVSRGSAHGYARFDKSMELFTGGSTARLLLIVLLLLSCTSAISILVYRKRVSSCLLYTGVSCACSIFLEYKKAACLIKVVSVRKYLASCNQGVNAHVGVILRRLLSSLVSLTHFYSSLYIRQQFKKVRNWKLLLRAKVPGARLFTSLSTLPNKGLLIYTIECVSCKGKRVGAVYYSVLQITHSRNIYIHMDGCVYTWCFWRVKGSERFAFRRA